MMNSFKHLLDSFLPVIFSNVEKVSTLDLTLCMPKIPADQVVKLCNNARTIFQSEATMLELHAPLLIVGDIHGHILDLFRILARCGMPPMKKYLFLGDLVDRGEFSTETVILIFLLKITYPNHIFLIRGNHEFNFLAQQCGFYTETIEVYEDPSVYNAIMNAFAFIPLAARIDNKILCVHGGIGPEFTSLRCLKGIVRPLTDYGDNDVINAILWSDPSESVDDYAPSSRGSGYLYGENALNEFIKNCNLDLVVRGHECVNDGIEEHFNGHLITVFSASNYCGLIGNQAGVLMIKESCKYEVKKFPPLEYLKRSNVIFGQNGSVRMAREGAHSSRRLTKNVGGASSYKIVPPIAGFHSILNNNENKKPNQRIPDADSLTSFPKLKEKSTKLSPRFLQSSDHPTLVKPPPSHRRCISWY